jgi:hypothetical protein
MTALFEREAPAPVEPFFRPAAEPRTVEITDAIDCTVEAVYRVGNGAAADFACGRHRWEVVAAHYKREPNLPIYDLDPGNEHLCNEVRAAEAEVSR